MSARRNATRDRRARCRVEVKLPHRCVHGHRAPQRVPRSALACAVRGGLHVRGRAQHRGRILV